MSTHEATHDAGKYYVPHSSGWPILGSITLFVLMWGAVSVLNGWMPGWALIPGFAMLALLFFLWFRTVIDENQRGVYNLEVALSSGLGLLCFLPSGVFFSAFFFGAFFYPPTLS